MPPPSGLEDSGNDGTEDVSGLDVGIRWMGAPTLDTADMSNDIPAGTGVGCELGTGLAAVL
jgi:hypothetical protein